ncbi:MAG TPA: hypothetical protein VLE97_09120 [Gaiellaceae bacterium]|nr:hypothetical protein [Gaiellaceae bacterium]
MKLREIYRLAQRYVPPAAADRRLADSGPDSWWPAHEIGHFLVATQKECAAPKFGIDGYELPDCTPARYRYVVAKEIAATSISQRLLRRAGHGNLADEEIQYTDETTLECSFERWCRSTVGRLLAQNRVTRLPTTACGLERLLARKTREVSAILRC